MLIKKLKSKVVTALVIILQRTFLLPILRHLAWADKGTKARIQHQGVDVIWSHYYSSIPSVDEIESSYEYVSDEPPYLSEDLFNDDQLKQTLEKLVEFSPEFDPPQDGDEQEGKSFFWNNSQYSYCDAMSYYCFIRMLQPKNIVEIGSGFSTLIAVDAIEKNGVGQISCIEPYPRKFLLDQQGISLHTMKAQEIDIEFLNGILSDGDILFIDSTHTVKTGSDCLHIYLRLLPKIQHDIYIHVHDVCLPFGMPKEWLLTRQIFWTEQYLLMAFLIDNPKAFPLYSSIYNARWQRELMEKMMRNRYPVGGVSFWFRYNGKAQIGVMN